MNDIIYFDNSATTKPIKEVYSAIIESSYGNPSSLHSMGFEAESRIKLARDQISKVLSIDSKEIVFTSGGTESNNLAIIGYLEANPRCGNHIITTKIEHPSVTEVFKSLEKNGYKVDYINVDINGIINIEEFSNALTEETALISIMHVNNEVGSIQPLDEINKIRNLKNKSAVIHVDAIQSFGKIKINPKKLGISLLSLSAHKIHGLKGIGALFIDNSIKIKPLILGGGQENGVRSGTENVIGIVSLGIASELAEKHREIAYENAIKLNRHFRNAILENVEFININSSLDSSPFILNVSFEKIKAEVLLHHLSGNNIYISTGSACSSKKKIFSKVLKEMKIEEKWLEGSVRFSFSRFNTIEEIDKVIEVLKILVPKIRYGRGTK